jgi:hypothetical protein
MRWQWRLRTMLILVALAAVTTWGIYLKRRSDAFRGLALREAGIKAKLLEMALESPLNVGLPRMSMHSGSRCQFSCECEQCG